MSRFWNVWPFRFGKRRNAVEAARRSGDLPWQRPRRLHERKDKQLYDALQARLTLVANHSNRYAMREYHRDNETGQLWELRDADIGHTEDLVLWPVEAIPAEPLPDLDKG